MCSAFQCSTRVDLSVFWPVYRPSHSKVCLPFPGNSVSYPPHESPPGASLHLKRQCASDIPGAGLWGRVSGLRIEKRPGCVPFYEPLSDSDAGVSWRSMLSNWEFHECDIIERIKAPCVIVRMCRNHPEHPYARHCLLSCSQEEQASLLLPPLVYAIQVCRFTCHLLQLLGFPAFWAHRDDIDLVCGASRMRAVV